MKKLLAIVLIFVFVISLAACGDTKSDNNTKVDNSSVISVESKNDETSSSTPNENTESEWKKFIKDYEAWVDEYIELTKKMKNNPTDTSILTEYTDMASKALEWTERSEEIQKSITNQQEAIEYANELLRIADKMLEAVE